MAKRKAESQIGKFDSRPVKIKNRPDFHACKWRATYYWKVINKDYNFASNFISIGGLHSKLWGSKVTGIPILAISRLPLGSHGTKSHFDMGLVERHRVYYKGEGGGSPQVWAVVNLMSSSLLVVCPSTKTALTMH
jgi:hypothetical protein